MTVFDMEMLGENIRHLRKVRGMTQEELAKKAGLSTMSIRRYESGERIVTEKAMVQIATALDVDVNWLMNGYTLEQRDQALKDYVASRFKEAQDCKESNDRGKLNAAFDQLNADGQQKAVERVEELTEIPKYQRQPPQGTPLTPKDTTPPENPSEGPQEGK